METVVQLTIQIFLTSNLKYRKYAYLFNQFNGPCSTMNIRIKKIYIKSKISM